MTALERLHGYLAERHVPHALIGGHALAARGYARFTLDVDILTTNRNVLQEEFWTALRERVVIRLGDSDDPLRGVVRIALSDAGMVDVIVGRYQWQHDVLERAELLEISDVSIPVARASDLILLKLFAGGPQDLADIRAILEAADHNEVVAEVRAHLATLPEDCATIFDQLAGV